MEKTDIKVYLERIAEPISKGMALAQRLADEGYRPVAEVTGRDGVIEVPQYLIPGGREDLKIVDKAVLSSNFEPGSVYVIYQKQGPVHR